MSEKKTKKLIAMSIALFLVLVVGIGSCSIIGPTEEAVAVTLGTVDESIITPGLHFKVPFIQHFKKIDKSPIEYKKSIPLGEKALITKDGQSLGIDFTMVWKYKDGSVVTVANKYSSKESLYSLISNPCKQAFKSEIGNLEALEFVSRQDSVISSVATRVSSEAARLNLPIEILNIVVENISWDSGFEAQIKKTAETRAQVEQANQEALREAANAQKKVAQAKADREASEESATADLIKAQKDAEAKKVEADALAYYNAKVAQNYQVEIKLKELEIAKIRAEKWNGVEVSSQSVYVPNTYDLKTGVQ